MRFLFGVLAVFSFATGVQAQTAATENPIPAFRFLSVPDTDFYGSDLDNLFDTDIASCIRACSANASCAGFTFNLSALACFPKSAVSEQTPFP